MGTLMQISLVYSAGAAAAATKSVKKQPVEVRC